MKKKLQGVLRVTLPPKQISSNWRNTFYAIMSIMVLLLSNTINAQTITADYLNASASSLGEPFVANGTYKINDYIYQEDAATPTEINIYRVSKAGFDGRGALADATFVTAAKASVTQTNVTFTYVGFLANATQTWTCPAGVNSFTVTAYGGGGAGGCVNNASGTTPTNRITSGGGGAGSTVSNSFTRANSSASANFNVIVGQGGYKGGTSNGTGFYGHRGGKSEFSGTGITTLTASGGTGGTGAGPYNRLVNGGGTLGGVYGFYIGTNGAAMSGYTNALYPTNTSTTISSVSGTYTTLAGTACAISSNGTAPGTVLHIVTAIQGAGYTSAPTVVTLSTGATGLNGVFTALFNPNINSGGSTMTIGAKGANSSGSASTGVGGAGGGTGGLAGANAAGGDAAANSSGGGGGTAATTVTAYQGGLGGSGKVVITYETPKSYTYSGSGALSDLSNWSDGSASPLNFTDGNVTYTINTDVTMAAPWTVTGLGSRVVIGATYNLTVNSSNSLTVENLENNGTLTIENNANLIQTAVANTNSGSGSTIVKRNGSALNRSDYTLWSSPVASQNLLAFSPATTPTRFYNYNTTFSTSGGFSAIASPSTTNFVAGSGYLIRMPNTDPTTNYDAGTATLAYPGVFTGTLNNGDVSVALTDGAAAGLRYNLVGNPYPSPIKMQNVVFDNTLTIEPTLYFWRKTNGSGTAYCSWVAGATVGDSGTFTTNGNAQSVDPSNSIQTGQGFFVEAKSGATTLTFKNSQRVANTTGQFFKTRQVAEASKIWLNATNVAGDFSQMAVTYFDGATNGVDAFDGKYINDSAIALTSNVNGGEYTIQGRPAFDASDVVALNFKTDKAADYTIAIDHTAGLFSSGQDVYLVDSKTGTETNLKTSSYTFTAATGVDNARFSLKYQKTLKVDASTFNENSVRVYKNNGTLYVNSGAKAINNVKVYDIQGRLIAELKNVKATTASINNLKANHQVVLVKISGEDNSVVTKKVVN